MLSVTARLTVVMIASLWVSTALSVEKDKGLYIGGSLGQAFVEDDGGNLDINDEDIRDIDLDSDETAYKLFAGYKFMRYFAVEGSYVDFGEPDDSSGGINFEKEIEGWDVFAVGFLPLWRFDLIGKIGAIDWETTNRISGDVLDIDLKDEDDGFDPAYGLGASFAIGSFAIRGEVELFDIEDADDLYLLSVGGTFTF